MNADLDALRWQEIGSAPKGGRDIYLLNDGYVFRGGWKEDVQEFTGKRCEPMFWRSSDESRLISGELYQVTHWAADPCSTPSPHTKP